MNCPRDNAVLSSVRKGRLEVNVCEVCNGFSVLLRQDAAGALEKQLHSSFSKSAGGNELETLRSPYTGNPMRRFLYRGIQLDYCQETHSLWFDQGEYSKMFRSPESKASSLKSGASEVNSKAWEVIDSASNSIDMIEVIGEVLSQIVSGVDLF